MTETETLAEKLFVAFNTASERVRSDAGIQRFAAGQALAAAMEFITVRDEWRAAQPEPAAQPKDTGL